MHTLTATPTPWQDSKRSLWLLGLFVPFLPLAGALLAAQTGSGLFWWLTPAIVYLVLPALDALIGADTSNPPADAVPALDADRFYRWCTYLFIPLQLATVVAGAWLAMRGGLATVDVVGLGLSVGVVSGFGINAAHELGHKREAVERWLARVALASSAYGHFFVEHNRGHHVRVATPEDPASSRLGESFWEFLPRTVIGSFRSAWHLEAARLQRQGLPAWHWRNENLQAWAMTVVLFGGLALWLGAGVLPFLVLQAVFGFASLEVVNYIEHYGLKRARLADGRYERCAPSHSWNSNHVVTNLMLYQLQRHSDHHANPTRRYQALRHFDESPQLPSGYSGMMLVAYVPPLWRRLMDRRVLAHYEGDVTRANIHPRVREQVLARYGRSA